MARFPKSTLPPGLIIRTGRLVWSGLWHVMMSRMAPPTPEGDYVRPASEFRQSLGSELFPPDADRYCLIVGMGCPWAHRTLVVRALKGLAAAVPVVLVEPDADRGSWRFIEPFEGCDTLPELYQLAQSGYQGRSTVPVLWDSQQRTIVNNESAEIIVMLDQALNGVAAHAELELYPTSLRPQIDAWNERIYATVNNGVYRCGFAQSQAAYDRACTALFSTLDAIDGTLANQRYLCGNRITLADVRLFTTLFRFDAVYYSLFKCDRRRIQDYPFLGPYLRDLYQQPGIADTCDLEAVKRDYFGNLFPLNPGGIIPQGPGTAFLEKPHNRAMVGI
ncbi:glutathione-dependent reductase [filamentous cyanobacterium CCP5]|nr:glutathione-dependent reductase [filamentous cyanobacterium CCP5]